MHDDLEEFIKKNRNAFDDEGPGDHVLENILKNVQAGKKKGKGSNMVFWRAAAVFLFLVSAWLVFDKFGSLKPAAKESAQESTELLEAERFYISVINEKKRELVKMSRGEEPLERDFLSDLDALDSAYSVLKKEVNTGNETEIEEAMIRNLQLRIEVLNRQLNILKKLKNENVKENVSI